MLEAGSSPSLSIVDRLINGCNPRPQWSDSLSPTAQVLSIACMQLDYLHNAAHITREDGNLSAVLDKSRPRKVIHGLVDLIILEGIYPSLSPGVGVPVESRLRSSLKQGLVVKASSDSSMDEEERLHILRLIVEKLVPIVLGNSHVTPIVKERMIFDLITALGELSYSPSSINSMRDHYALRLQDVLNR